MACNDERVLSPAGGRDVRATLARAGRGEGGYGGLKESNGCPEMSIPPGFHARRIDRTGDALSEGTMELVKHFVSLSGTPVNCAGGITPWGSWLSCEETVVGPAQGYLQNHGYIFEIPSGADAPVVPVPLKEMGRIVHEAIAVDPLTGIVCETEDRGTSGFYRFIPNVPGQLAQGEKLQMLAMVSAPNHDTRKSQTVGQRFACTGVDIDQPDSADPNLNSLFVFNHGCAKGGAVFARL